MPTGASATCVRLERQSTLNGKTLLPQLIGEAKGEAVEKAAELIGVNPEYVRLARKTIPQAMREIKAEGAFPSTEGATVKTLDEVEPPAGKIARDTASPGP